ncbi:MAG TPA: DUF4388 domain-containing protein [bacterium]
MKAETKELVILEGSIENIPPSSIIMLLYNLRKSGILRFTIDAFIIKSIYFRNGNVVFATSTRNDDRLGESLVRNGLITDEQLNESAKEITPARKLGKILVEKGYITAKELFFGVRRQIEEILISIFRYPSGIFEFRETIKMGEAANIPLNTRNTILHGLRECKIIYDLKIHFPSFDYHIDIGGDISEFEFDEDENKIIAGARGKNLLKNLLNSQDRATVNAIGRLLEVGAIVKGSRFSPDEFRISETTKELLQNLNSVIMDIYSIIKSKSAGRNVHETLNTFFLNPSPAFREMRLNNDGSIDINKLTNNLQQIPGDKNILFKAIQDLLQFELFELRHYLKKEEEQELIEIIHGLNIER